MERLLLCQRVEEAKRHVDDNECRLARQRQILADLERRGHDTTVALESLERLEKMQCAHVAELDRVLVELDELGPEPLLGLMA
jgi:hypothetical protein